MSLRFSIRCPEGLYCLLFNRKGSAGSCDRVASVLHIFVFNERATLERSFLFTNQAVTFNEASANHRSISSSSFKSESSGIQLVMCVCACVCQLYTIHVIQAGGSDKTPAVITRRYSEFQKLHVRLCRHHGEQMERVHFPRKLGFLNSAPQDPFSGPAAGVCVS